MFMGRLARSDKACSRVLFAGRRHGDVTWGAECWQGQNTMSWRWGLWVLLQFWRIWRNITYKRHRESKKVPVPEPKMDTGKAGTVPVPKPTMGRGKVGTTHVPVASMIASLTLLRSHWIVSPSDLWPNPCVSWKIRAVVAVGILTLWPRPLTLVCLSLVEGLLTTNAFLVGSLL